MINNPISEQYFDEACVGYLASQEQYSMQQIIEFVKEAGRGGIITTMTSDQDVYHLVSGETMNDPIQGVRLARTTEASKVIE